MFTFRLYDDGPIWNVRPDEDFEPNDAIAIASFSANRIELQLENGGYGVLIGDFIGNGPSVLGQVEGTISRLEAYRHGELLEEKTWAPGYSMWKFTYGSYDEDITALFGDDLFQGSLRYAENDTVQGLAGNDVFIGFGDEASFRGDIFYGGEGVDTAVFRGNLSDYAIVQNVPVYDERVHNGSFVAGMSVHDGVAGRDGMDQLVEVERLQFDDVSLAFDVDGVAGYAYRLYQAAFDRKPDQEGLGYWINELDKGYALKDVAYGFLNSGEFIEKYGSNLSNEAYVDALYWNVLHRAGDADGRAHWVGALNGGFGREELLIQFSDVPENRDNVAVDIQQGIRFENWDPVSL